MSENISANNIYQTQIPSLTDAADIQDAFKLYHFGTTTEPANASLLTEGVAKHLYDLQTLKAPIAGPTFTGTLTAPTINASTALQIGGVAITSTAAELNILDGVTATAAELNILDGVTSTTAELNILDGVTSTAAELNILDGVTSTAAELNLVDGSSAGTVVTSKAVIYGASGEVNATTLQIAGTNVLAAATPLPGAYGGTGVANTGKTITVSGNTTIGSSTHTVAFATSGNTSITLPTSGTLVNSAVTTLSSLASIGTITTGTWNGSVIAGQYGGTGVANTGKTITVSGNTTIGSSIHTVAFATSGNTSVTLPTSGTLVARDTTDTLTNKTLTSPDINAGTADSLTSLSVRDTSAAYDVTIAATSSTTLTAGRTLTLDLVNAARTLKLGANISANAALTINSNAVTLAGASGGSSVTLPSSGTLVASGAIVNTDISASAAILDTKLANISTANKVSLSAIDIDGATDIGAAIADADLLIIDDGGAGTNRKMAATRVPTYVFSKVSGDVAIDSSGVATIQANSVALGTDTTGNYVATITASGSGITINNSGTESAAVTIANSGVTSIAGTTNEITVSANTGAVTVSLPSTINADTSGNAASATAGSVYSTGTTTKDGNRRIFVGASQPDSSNAYGQGALQVGDIWIDV